MLNIHTIPLLHDNYGYVFHAQGSNEACVVDPSEAGPVLSFLEKNGLQLKTIINTHHHPDHVGGNLELKTATNAEIIASAYDHAKGRIPGCDRTIDDGDSALFAGATFKAIAIPGHTLGHIALWCEAEKTVFTGDTLFSIGCGRLFEGTPEMMVKSMEKLLILPEDTRVYCGHEYTEANLQFALSVDPDNLKLREKYATVRALRAEGKSTIPSLLGEEKQLNPFLRFNDLTLRSAMNRKSEDKVTIFAALRQMKNCF